MTEVALYAKAKTLMEMLEEMDEGSIPNWRKKVIYDHIEEAQSMLHRPDRRKDSRRS